MNNEMLMEDRLNAGPFSTADADVQHLQNPQEAFYRLLDVFPGINKGSPYRTDIQAPTMCSIPKAQRLYNDSLELYFSTPPANTDPSSFKTRSWYWAVRAQFVLQSSGGGRYFPTPEVKDPAAYGAAYAKADFNRTKRPFWADEQTHKKSINE